MSHLGRWLSALVDGELDPDERDHVLNHIAGCQGCMDEANAMRALKRRLTSFGESSSDEALASRLIELASRDPERERALPEPVSRWSDPSAGTPAPDARQPRASVQAAWRLAAGSAGAAVAALGVAAFMLGSAGTQPVPKVTPSVDSYLLQHAYDAGQAPATPGSGISPAFGGSAGPGSAAPGPGQSAAGSAKSAAGSPGQSPAGQPTGIAASARQPGADLSALTSPKAGLGSDTIGQSPGRHPARHQRP